MLSVEELDAFYGRLQVLFSVNLTVEEGKIVAIVGSNGAGKTTLLKSIMNIEVHKKGRVMYKGRDITKMSTHEIAKLGIFYIPDNAGLYPGLTVLENLRLATGRKNVNIDVLKEIYPEVTMLLNRGADKLSGGERKIVSILRVFLKDSKLILLDEPTEGVSPIVTERMYSIFKRLKDEGRTLVIVESGSRLKVALRYVDTLAVMTSGRLTYMDSAEKAIKDIDVIRRLIFV